MPDVRKEIEEHAYVGGSNIASVAGLGRWSSPLKEWAVLTKKIDPDDLSDNEAVQIGSEIEGWIAEKFQRETGIKVRRRTQAYVDPEYDFLKAHVDRKVEGSNDIIEIKNYSWWRIKEFGEEDIPTELICQLQWNMGLAGSEEGYAVVLIGGNKFRYQKHKFDKEMYDMLREKAIDFWINYIQADVPPATTIGDADVLAKLYPGNPELDVLVLEGVDDKEMSALIVALQATKKHIKNFEEIKEKYENELKQKMGDSEVMVASGGKVSWKSQSRKGVDTAKLKEDKLYDKYCKITESRVFRVLQKKEKKDE